MDWHGGQGKFAEIFEKWTGVEMRRRSRTTDRAVLHVGQGEDRARVVLD